MKLNYALSVYKVDGSVIHYQMKDLLEYFADFKDSSHLYYHDEEMTTRQTGSESVSLN